MINAKTLQQIKLILDYMNQEWPPPVKGVLSQMRGVSGKLENFYAKVDPYFTAYHTVDNTWWICVSDYWIWQESYSTLRDLAKCADGIKIFLCHVHPIQIKGFKDKARERKHINLFIGKVSWAN